MQRAPLTFVEMAVELRCAASRESFAVEQLELYRLRYPSAVSDRTCDDVRTTAERLGEISELLKALAPHEAEIRARLAPARPASQETEPMPSHEVPPPPPQPSAFVWPLQQRLRDAIRLFQRPQRELAHVG